MAKRRRIPKRTILKAHRIARGLVKHRAGVRNPWAVGMALAKRRKRRKR